MGKKYIVEIGRLERLYKAFIGAHGKPEIAWLSPEVDLTPYTEPDLEQVREEAYQRGYCDALEKHCAICEEKHDADEAYQQGLNDAWECARKIANMPYDEEEKVFGSGGWTFIENHTAAEAIEKIRQYEQEKEEQIQVGDEVRNIKGGWTAVVSKFDGECMTLMDTNGALGDGYDVNRFTKTGRHFPQIATVLEKMREG